MFFKRIWQDLRGKGAFTLVELLLVIAILGILAAISAGQFVNAQRKARDAQRKTDLGSVQRALEMYFADYSAFPAEEDISGIWGGEFSDGETIYMKVLPVAPGALPYCYVVSGDGMAYGLFAVLENCPEGVSYAVNTCSSTTRYCWAVTSPNTSADEAKNF